MKKITREQAEKLLEAFAKHHENSHEHEAMGDWRIDNYDINSFIEEQESKEAGLVSVNDETFKWVKSFEKRLQAREKELEGLINEYSNKCHKDELSNLYSLIQEYIKVSGKRLMIEICPDGSGCFEEFSKGRTLGQYNAINELIPALKAMIDKELNELSKSRKVGEYPPKSKKN